MKLTAEVIDSTMTAMKDYEKLHFGLRHGEDFPQIAQCLAASKQFTDMCVTQGMMGMLAMLSLPKNADRSPEDADKLISDLKSSPVRDGLALMFYAGFKLGQRFAENKALEMMITSKEKDQ